jgi:hypothetical protein
MRRRPATMIDDSAAAWSAISEALAISRRAMGRPVPQARQGVAKALEELRTLKRTQPFEWAYPQDARLWFETLCSYITRAEDLLRELTEREAAEVAR